ncbi:hypothetical protein IV203_023535 [Nitzschia inconspicua]|uniref:KANL3/Tex30 alpha/beta hydrolase-like domain-containing protein n=1 Tax=Nitzschia inconspicua TaxID=303405 RepID=A0A9K3KD88_9STRA|nr:hypothetical protein IV203_023535 [Nitzschia inconspicua]
MPSSVKEQSYSLPDSGSIAQVANLGSDLAVIVTHPWGPLGGNMNNNVVLAIVVWFQRLQITTMRFDFSGHQIGKGHRQVQQVKEAANFLLSGAHLDGSTSHSYHHQTASSTTTTSPHKSTKQPPKSLLLVGYSYGSIISGSASIEIPQCIGVAMISPPLAVRHWLYLFHGNYHLEQARKSGLPLIMILGSRDNFTGEDSFMEVVQSMPTATTTGAVLKDADHFFRGREQDLMDVLGHWILNVFPQCQGDLKKLCQAEFPSFAPPLLNNAGSGDSFMGCGAFMPGE